MQNRDKLRLFITGLGITGLGVILIATIIGSVTGCLVGLGICLIIGGIITAAFADQ